MKNNIELDFKRIDNKLAISFGGIILFLMILIFAISALMFSHISKTEKTEFALALASDLTNSIKIINYSGIYQTRLYLEDTKKSNEKIVSISFFDTSGKIVAHTNPEKNGHLEDVSNIENITLDSFSIRNSEKNLITIEKRLKTGYLDSDENILSMTMDLSSKEELLSNMTIYMALTIAILLLFSFFVVNRLSHYYGVPIKNIALKLQEKTKELEETNKNLEIKIKKEVDIIKQKDEIIYEQNRKNALGELLLNIAHQWRQPLNIIALNTHSLDEMVAEDEMDKDEFSQKCNIIQDEVQYLSSIISKFTKYYRQSQKIEEFTLHSALVGALNFVGQSLQDSNIEVIEHINRDLAIRGEASILIEIFVGMLTNVKDICEERGKDGAKVEIRATRDGDDAIIEIEDNAGGIDKNILPSIFDPYTTSKFKSKNKGLGLYMIKNSIDYRLNGHIEAKNLEDGALFIIRIDTNPL